MEQLVINATKRDVTGKQVRALRRGGKLPGVIYGHKFDSVPVTMDQKEATTILNQATSSSIITIKLDGKDVAALIRDRQRDFIRNTYLHVDFQAVSLTEMIRTEVNIELTGLAPAVKDYSGILVEGLTSIHVEALPNDLPEKFIIDISVLKEIGDNILVKDITVSDKVTILTPLEEMVILVTAPAAEEEVAPEEVAEGEGPEVIEKGKKEEEAETKEK